MKNWIIDIAASIDRIVIDETPGKTVTVELIDSLGGYTVLGTAAAVNKAEANIAIGYPYAFKKAAEQMIDRYSYASLMPGYAEWHRQTFIRHSPNSFKERIEEEGAKVFLVRNDVLYEITYVYDENEKSTIRTPFGVYKMAPGDYFIFSFVE